MKTDMIQIRTLPYRFPLTRYIQITCIYTMFIRTCKKDFYFPGELHEPWELVYIIDGMAGATSDDKVYQLKKGDIIFHKPCELHKFWAESNDLHYFVCTFDLIGPKAKKFCGRTFHLTESDQSFLLHLLSTLSELDVPETTGGYHYYSREWNQAPILIESAVVGLESLLMRTLTYPNISSSITQEAPLFTKAVRHIKESLNQNISIDELAEKCETSPSSLKKCFAQYAGCGVHKYVLLQRLQFAIQLLQEGKSVSEVSESLNFSSPNYFSYVFRREFGHSPSYYRK